MKIGIIYNNAKKLNILNQFLSELNLPCEILHTDSISQGIDVTQKLIDSGCDVLVSAGGDGTLLSVVNGIMMQQKLIPIAVLPLGTSNDYARALNINNYKDTIRAILNQTSKKTDLIQSTFYDESGKEVKMYANLYTEIGLASSIYQFQFKKSYQFWRRWFGSAADVVAAMKKLIFPSEYYIQTNINGSYSDFNILHLGVYKIKKVGPVSMVPFAELDDGKLTGVLYKYATPLWRHQLMPRLLMSNKKIKDNRVVYFGENADRSINEITIVSKQPIPIDLNAEFVGFTPCTFKIVPQVIEFFFNKADCL